MNWSDVSKGELLFSHGTINSCGIMIGCFGSEKIKDNRIKNEIQGRIVIGGAGIDEETFVLINLYNPNTKMGQSKTICELDQLLGDFCLNSNKKQYLQGISIKSLIQVWDHRVVNPF